MISRRPYSVTVRSTTDSTDLLEATLAVWKIARFAPYFSIMTSWVACSGASPSLADRAFGWISEQTTAAPSFARRSAIARPIPVVQSLGQPCNNNIIAIVVMYHRKIRSREQFCSQAGLSFCFYSSSLKFIKDEESRVNF
jgi:hypothetical protein